MNYNFEEFSFSIHISKESVYEALSLCWSRQRIIPISREEYIQHMPDPDIDGDGWEDKIRPYLGIDIFWTEEDEFKTFIRVSYFDEKLEDIYMDEISQCLAKRLNTDVVISDFMHSGGFIVYTPSGNHWFGIEKGIDAPDYFSLEKIEYESDKQKNTEKSNLAE